MLKSVVILVLSCFLYAMPAQAYEFTEINTLWDILFSNYAGGKLNLKNISLNSGKAVTEIDESFKLYNSDSKIFLYKQNNLVATFKFPDNNNSSDWKKLLADILTAGMENSVALSNNPQILENKVIIKITENLDRYSRIEKDITVEKRKMTYKFINNVLYVHSGLFYNGFSDYLKKIISSHPALDGIILDLRNNKGGDFNEAIRTADLFLDNSLIAYRESKNLPNRYYIAESGDILNGKPVVILTNENTASSAEMVTAALNEQSRATLIGTKTYGKNSTQLTYQQNKQRIFITNGAFYTPSGKQINQSGISPKICTGLNNSCTNSDKKQSDKDIYMAIRLIKENFG